MIQSMTGFGGRSLEIPPFGKIAVELRSSNHKFLEIVFHLPEGFLSLEDRLKKEIEAKIKRGRITCAVNIIGGASSNIFINKALLKNYVSVLKKIKKQHQLQDEISINTLVHLPGILSLGENCITKAGIWPRLKALVKRAVEDLARMRQKEGRATFRFLKQRADTLQENLKRIKTGFKKAVQEKLKAIPTDEERSGFLRDSDITEEIERLSFHIRNFKNRLNKSGPVGKELDFIAQEMQREANTMAAKSFAAAISGRLVQMKSQIEKIREQVQNIE